MRRTTASGQAGARLVGGLVVVVLVYLGATGAKVWWASRDDQARPAEAIVVLGAAQYDGEPSPVLRARLDHAADLYRRGLAPIVVVTGGRKPGDRSREATASANYLLRRGLPEPALRREVHGRNTWESLAATARFLQREDVDEVLLVSDPYHAFRLRQIAREVGLRAWVSPTRMPGDELPAATHRVAREVAAVSLGQVLGYRRLVALQQRLGTLSPPDDA